MNIRIDCPTVPFYNISVYSGSVVELIKIFRSFLEEDIEKKLEVLTVYTPNPEQMVLAWENPEFFRILQRGDLLLPDGSGIVWALNRDKRRERRDGKQATRVERIAGREVFHELLGIAKEKQLKVFLLGGKKGSAKKVLEKWGMAPPAGAGKWSVDDGPKENESAVLVKIAEVRPDILFVAYGAPAQEFWIDRNREILKRAGVKLAMVVGGAFEYEAGQVPPVSSVVQNLHLEWLQRLILEPWRAGRQLKGLKFFFRVLLSP